MKWRSAVNWIMCHRRGSRDENCIEGLSHFTDFHRLCSGPESFCEVLEGGGEGEEKEDGECNTI